MSSGHEHYAHKHRGSHGFPYYGYGYGSHRYGGYYDRQYSYYAPYSYGGHSYYGGSPYDGYGGQYGYEPGRVYGDSYADSYPPAPGPGGERGPVPPDGEGYAVESRGWTLLVQGHYRAALEEFVREAQQNPAAARPKAGYALAAASMRDLPRGVWAMRRACDADPESMHGMVVDKSLRPAVDRVIAVYQADLARDPRNADSSFMLAALQCLVGDAQAAGKSVDAAIQLGDRNPSTMHLKRVIDQESASPDGPAGDVDRQQSPPPDPASDSNGAIPVPPPRDNGNQSDPTI